MRKLVLRYGLIAGAILSLTLAGSLALRDRISFEAGPVIGYTSMVVAFLLVFVGVRRYRDEVAGGTIRFGRALAVGGAIALVASTCYVATWQVIYHSTGGEYIAEYQAHMLERAREDGADDAEIARRRAEMERFAELYRNPAVNIAVTFLEPLPVALVMALVAAGVLSRRRRPA